MFSKIVLKNPRMFSNLMCCLLYEREREREGRREGGGGEGGREIERECGIERERRERER